jgi:hypothetical protein
MSAPPPNGPHDSTRDGDRHDAFAKTVDTPMLDLTILWLPVLLVPLVTPVHNAVAR